jgi:pseudaminic acid synthase
MKQKLQIGQRWVGEGAPTYFIAEVGANFDGSLSKAKEYVVAAKESGADAVKFQTFTAEKLVSSHSFKKMQVGYQANWAESTYQVYKKAEFPRDWHHEIAEYSKSQGIEFFTSVWDLDAVDLLEKLNVSAYKIGSGDITWFGLLRKVAATGKPVILSTGASEMAEVAQAVDVLRNAGCDQLVVLQCIVNYPSQHASANIRVMETYRNAFGTIVGYSDHAPGDVVALGSVALGGKMIEKHFTLDRKLQGPDHPHSMENHEFAQMVQRVRQLESALGIGEKHPVAEEKETRLIMRRALHATRPIKAGETITADMLVPLRPANGISPALEELVIGKRATRDIAENEALSWSDI